MPEQGPEEPMVEEQKDVVNLIPESLVVISNLNEVKVFLFTEMQEQRQILSCPPALFKCSMDIRPPQDPTVVPCNDPYSLYKEEPNEGEDSSGKRESSSHEYQHESSH